MGTTSVIKLKPDNETQYGNKQGFYSQQTIKDNRCKVHAFGANEEHFGNRKAGGAGQASATENNDNVFPILTVEYKNGNSVSDEIRKEYENVLIKFVAMGGKVVFPCDRKGETTIGTGIAMSNTTNAKKGQEYANRLMKRLQEVTVTGNDEEKAIKYYNTEINRLESRFKQNSSTPQTKSTRENEERGTKDNNEENITKNNNEERGTKDKNKKTEVKSKEEGVPEGYKKLFNPLGNKLTQPIASAIDCRADFYKNDQDDVIVKVGKDDLLQLVSNLIDNNIPFELGEGAKKALGTDVSNAVETMQNSSSTEAQKKEAKEVIDGALKEISEQQKQNGNGRT